MGLQDRDWYREELKRKEALIKKKSPLLQRWFVVNIKPDGETSPFKAAIYTILALAVFTLVMRFVLKR